MQVRVEDIQGRIHEISQSFSLDNSKPSLKLFSQWPLNVYFPDVVSKYNILFYCYFSNWSYWYKFRSTIYYQ